jgi:hypothetical protein
MMPLPEKEIHEALRSKRERRLRQFFFQYAIVAEDGFDALFQLRIASPQNLQTCVDQHEVNMRTRCD